MSQYSRTVHVIRRHIPNKAKRHVLMVKKDTQSVGRSIWQTREKRGLSIQELPDKAGCSDEYLSWVEAGRAEPPVALLIHLAKAMELDSGAFLQTAGSPNRRLEVAAKRTEHYLYKTLTPPVMPVPRNSGRASGVRMTTRLALL